VRWSPYPGKDKKRIEGILKAMVDELLKPCMRKSEDNTEESEDHR
jgi:hypothetical protein